MRLIYYMVFALFALLMILSRKEKVKLTEGKKKWQIPMYKAAAFLLKKFSWRPGKEKTEKVLAEINGTRNLQEKVKAHYIERLCVFIRLLLLGSMAAVLVTFASLGQKVLQEQQRLPRNDWGEGDYQVILEAKQKDGQKEEIEITVKERHGEPEEAEAKAEELMGKLPDLILGQNRNKEFVRQDLALMSEVLGYPFAIRWESSNGKLLRPDGRLMNENVREEGEEVILCAYLKYGEMVWEKPIDLRIYPPVLTEKDSFRKSLMDAVESIQKETLYLDEFSLPLHLKGRELHWTEKQEDRSFIIWLLFIAAAWYGALDADRKLHQKVAAKRGDLIREYPEFVNRLVLYLGTGIPLKSAWEVMVLSYETQKREGKITKCVYEEMRITYYEFQNGMEEGEGYHRFGIRCHDGRYRKLAALLSGNVKKGNDKLLELLRLEAEMALEEQKTRARKIGEEANIKLLVPMILMLCVVMVIILIPAYGSFTI